MEPTFSEEKLVDVVLAVAAGKTRKQELIALFEQHSRPIPPLQYSDQ